MSYLSPTALIVVVGRVLRNGVYPSFHPSFCPSIVLSGHFFGILSLVFSRSWHGAGNSYEVYVTEQDFSLKIGKMEQTGAKDCFLE